MDDLVGAVITADAMHTQTATAASITARGGHYVLTVKANQPGLFARCKALPWAKIRAASAVDVIVSLENSAPFIDVEAQATQSHFDAILASRLAEPLDVADIRGRDRLLTRAIADWAYAQVGDDGDGMYSGIRYMSRLGDYACWAVFDGTPVAEAGPAAAIEASDSALERVARDFGLTIH